MKIAHSVRLLYEDLRPNYVRLQETVDKLISSQKHVRWHYESRIKEAESFALKIETGRVIDPRMPEDLFACTLVVENHGRISDAEKLVLKLFKLQQRRPKDPERTHLEPHSFEFDDLRLYVRWGDDPSLKPTGLHGLIFEVQIKTFLQHAWGIATHDFIYKSDDVDWSGRRIAYQVKAMLENAELSISEAKKLTASSMLRRTDGRSADLRTMIEEIKKRWDAALLPADLCRLAEILDDLMWKLNVPFEDLWKCVDEATVAGAGAKILDLSPYAAILTALIRKRGTALFAKLADPRLRGAVFVPLEIDLPAGISTDALKKIVRPSPLK